MSQKLLVIGVLVALILGCVAIFRPSTNTVQTSNVGGITGLTGLAIVPQDNGDGFSVGSTTSPTNFSGIYGGTCNLTFSAATLGATSTGQFFCSVPGVLSGDRVLAVLQNGHAMAFGTITVADSFATTSNRIGVTLMNLSGAATTSFALATTGVQYYIFR